MEENVKDKSVEDYEQRTGIKLDASQRDRLRKVLNGDTVEAQWAEFWDNEDRILKDSNRYHDDN